MSIARWQPFDEIMSLRQAMDKLMEGSFVTSSRSFRFPETAAAVPIDMYQTDSDVVVKATIPGVKPEELDITISGDTLTIKGETRSDEEVKNDNYFCQEHRYGVFRRSVALPAGLKTDKTAADFENGVLTLNIPKAEETKPKAIKVKAKSSSESK